MALLSVANLIYSIGERRLLDGVNLTLSDGEHVGLVGRNGCGKSTLLKLIAGLGSAKPDSGQVQLARAALAGYLTQEPELDPARTLRDEAVTALAHLHEMHAELERVSHAMAGAQGEELSRLMSRYEQLDRRIHAAGGFVLDHQIDATLHGVGLTDEFFAVKVADLSGGQKGRLALAKLLLSHPDVLLLDEPTNHLDIEGRQWLEEYLRQYNGGVVIVSHDRWMLDRVVTTIYELEDGRMIAYPGNYQKYRELRAQRRLTQMRVYERQAERIRHEQDFIARYRAGQRAKQAKSREKLLARFVRDGLVDRPMELDEMHLRFVPGARSGDLVVTADGLSKAYEGKTLFRDLSLSLQRGDRVGIIGPNGSGKTTLVNCLLGEQQSDAGASRLGANLSVGYYRQTHEHLDLSLTVVDYLRRFVMGGSGALGSEQAARDLAGAFLFSGGDQDKTLAVLSGGERSRVVLAGLVVSRHNLLVLDEPTNHLDIPSAERLETALKQFTGADRDGPGQKWRGEGTLILITHDRMLLQDLVDQLVILDGRGGARMFPGTYGDYLQWLQSQAAATAGPAPRPVGKKPPPPTETPPRRNKNKAPPKSPLMRITQQELETRIMTIETRVAKVDQALASPETYRDGPKVKALHEERDALLTKLAPLEEEWARRAELPQE